MFEIEMREWTEWRGATKGAESLVPRLVCHGNEKELRNGRGPIVRRSRAHARAYVYAQHVYKCAYALNSKADMGRGGVEV